MSIGCLAGRAQTTEYDLSATRGSFLMICTSGESVVHGRLLGHPPQYQLSS
jgi:hypothetical protein